MREQNPDFSSTVDAPDQRFLPLVEGYAAPPSTRSVVDCVAPPGVFGAGLIFFEHDLLANAFRARREGKPIAVLR